MPFALELAHPWLLAALVAAGGLVLGRLARTRRLGARDVPRALLALAVALAAGEPRVRDPAPPRTRILVVDRSASFAPARESVRAALELAGKDLDPARDRLAAVAFGARPVLAQGPLPASEAARVAHEALGASVDPGASDVGAALDLALETAREVGGAAEVVLLSDGEDTGGSARAAAERLASAGIVLHAVSPPATPPPDARVASVLVPSRAAVGEAVSVRVTVETTVRSPVAVSLELEGPAALFGPAEVTAAAEPGAPARVSFVVRAAEAGLVLVRARARLLAAVDELADDDALEASFVAGEQGRALLVAGAGPEPWRRLLESAHLGVDLATPERLAAAALDPARGTPDIVVLDEVPASALGPEPTAALERLLDAGSGLIVAGSEAAFGPGGYPDAPIEKLLPVRSGPPGEPRKPLVLELAIDASGSMGSVLGDARTRFLAAIDAVVPRARELRAGDLLGIVLFSESARVPRPLGPVGDESRLLLELKAIEPTGGTDVASGLVRALGEIGAREGRRLLVLVTDGEDPKAAGQAERVREAAASALRAGDLDVALVLVGDPAGKGRATLEALAKAVDPTGKHARTFAVAEAGPELGKLVRGAIAQVRNERRTGTFPVVDERGARLGAIAGYAPVEPRPLSRAVLTLEDPDHGGPVPLAVLAPGRAGSSLALATGLGSTGASLVASDAGRAAVIELVRRVARPLAGELELAAERRAGELEVTATVREGASLPAALLCRGATLEGGNLGEAPLVPRAPDVLGARIHVGSGERVLVTVRAPDGPALASLVVPSTRALELASAGRDLGLLSALAALTGDTSGVSPDLRSYAAPVASLAGPKLELAPFLALGALVLLLAEAGVAVLVERLAARRAARALELRG